MLQVMSCSTCRDQAPDELKKLYGCRRSKDADDLDAGVT